MSWTGPSAALPPVPSRSEPPATSPTRSWRDGGSKTTDVVLVVGELAANAVRHAHSAFTLSLYLLDDTVTVEVTDSSPATALMVRAPWNSTSGRGL